MRASSAPPGFDDRRRSALQACRHAFRSLNARLEINDALIDAIQGHRDKLTAGTYRHLTPAQIAAIACFPVLALAGKEDDGGGQIGA